MKSKKIIRSVDEIRELVRGINLLSTGKIKPVELDLEGFTKEENKELSDQLETLYSACGCAQGRTSGVFALVAFIVLVLAGVVPINDYGTTKTTLIFFVFAVVAMFFGKVYGLMKGRRALMNFAGKVEKMH